MADDNNIEARREVIGRGFNHTDPLEWPSAFAQEELQRAPDYRKNLDLAVVGPDGKKVSAGRRPLGPDRENPSALVAAHKRTGQIMRASQ